jgi:hypothetical protein
MQIGFLSGGQWDECIHPDGLSCITQTDWGAWAEQCMRGCFVLADGVTNANENGLSFCVSNHGVTRHWYAGVPQLSVLQGRKLG